MQPQWQTLWKRWKVSLFSFFSFPVFCSMLQNVEILCYSITTNGMRRFYFFPLLCSIKGSFHTSQGNCCCKLPSHSCLDTVHLQLLKSQWVRVWFCIQKYLNKNIPSKLVFLLFGKRFAHVLLNLWI